MITDELEFTITFHSPLLPATGAAAPGFDMTLDPQAPLRATALKGLMRSAARDLLGVPEALVESVFGSSRTPSPWHWRVTCQPEVTLAPRTRVEIDPKTRAAKENALLFMQVGVAGDDASFVVETDGLPSGQERVIHERILSASARACAALGSQRRRGLGWITVSGGADLAYADYELMAAGRWEDSR